MIKLKGIERLSLKAITPFKNIRDHHFTFKGIESLTQTHIF